MYRRGGPGPETEAGLSSVQGSNNSVSKVRESREVKIGWLTRALFMLFCLESLYIMSWTFSSESICDNLNSRKEHAKQMDSITRRLEKCISDLDAQLSSAPRTEKLQKLHAAPVDTTQENGEQERVYGEKLSKEENSGNVDNGVPNAQVISPTNEKSIVAQSQTWLAIGIPTVPRGKTKQLDYLSDTLLKIVQELPSVPTDPLFKRIRIVVMNNHAGDHHAFQKNRDYFMNSQWEEYFDFVDNVERKLETPASAKQIVMLSRQEASKAKRKPHEAPTATVQQQTRDIVSILSYVWHTHRPAYFLFMEDDFDMCSNGIEAARYLINRATRFHDDWIAIRTSFGLNGIFFHGYDVPEFARYLERHQARRPPDHLVTEWFAGETQEAANYKRNRVHIGFRYNLFKHRGLKSSLRDRMHQDVFPGCWEPLQESIVFEVESFKPNICPLDDIWPCTWNRKSCNPKMQLCLPDGTKPLEHAPKRIPWENVGVS